MRAIKSLVVCAFAVGLFACQPKNDMGEYEPYPDDPAEDPILYCQEACTADAQCPGGMVCSESCDPTTDVACGAPNRCVECDDDTDCAGSFCIAGSCVECVDDTVCTVPGASHCVDYSCVECAEDVDCGPGAPRCLDGVCTCSGSAQCAADERCMYTTDSARAAGVPGCVCKENSACAGIGPETCIAGICIECEFDTHCEASVGVGSTCADGGTLYATCLCADNAHCPPGRFCDASGSCVRCLSDTDCAGDLKCDTSGRCVECLEDTDCTALNLGSVCDGGSCSCGAAGECSGITSGLGGTAVCEE